MPPRRSARRAEASDLRAHPYAKSAAPTPRRARRAPRAETQQPAAPPNPQQEEQQQQGPPNRFMRLPAELRDEVYDILAQQMPRVILDSTKAIKAMGPHPLVRTSKQIRGEFLNRVARVHRARRYIVTVPDFDFSRLMHHLRRKNRLARVQRITIRHVVTKPDVDKRKVSAWLKFVQQNSFAHRHKVWGMPPVAVRRQFMAEVFELERVMGEVWPEVINITGVFEEWWDRGRAEMKWAVEGEEPPGGEHWEKDVLSDVDSDGDDD